MTFLPLDREELRDYNALCAEAGLAELNLVEANVLKAMVEISEEENGGGALPEEVGEATGYTPGQILQAISFLSAQGFVGNRPEGVS